MCSLTTAYSRFGVKKREKETENKDKSEMDKTHIHCNTPRFGAQRNSLNLDIDGPNRFGFSSGILVLDFMALQFYSD